MHTFGMVIVAALLALLGFITLLIGGAFVSSFF